MGSKEDGAYRKVKQLKMTVMDGLTGKDIDTG